MEDKIIVYGSDQCPHTQRMRQKLTGLQVAFRYVDIDQNPADEQRIAGWNNGRSIRPTLDIGGDIFVAPDPTALEEELKTRGLLAR